MHVLNNLHGQNRFLVIFCTQVLLMEELEQSLGDYIEKLQCNGRMTMCSKDICRVLQGASKALDYLHTEKYLLHGDIKSHNILINGNLKNMLLLE